MDLQLQSNGAPQVRPAPHLCVTDTVPAFALRRVIITENSQELERIHSGGRGQRSVGYLDGYDEETHGQHNRSLLAKVLHSAYEDIELAMRRPNPRVLERRVGRKVQQSENFSFRSAVHFFFAWEPVVDAAGRMGWFSVFNSYCVLLNLEAARLRGAMLAKFGGLEHIVSEIIKEHQYLARVERESGVNATEFGSLTAADIETSETQLSGMTINL